LSNARVSQQAKGDAWQKRTVWDRLLEVAAALPDKEFLITVDSTGKEARVSYGQVVDRADSLADSLIELGVFRGDKVALMMTNLDEWVVSLLAILRVGAILIPVNTWSKDREIEFVLRHSGARHLILVDRFRQVDFTQVLQRICPEWSDSVPGHLCSEALPDLRNVIVLQRVQGEGSKFAYRNAFDYHELVQAGEANRESLAHQESVAMVTPNDVATIMYTSGSSGSPKGAMLEQWGFVTASELLAVRLSYGENDRWFGAYPFFHVGGSIIGLMTTLVRGATLIFCEAHDAELEVSLVERERATFHAAVAAVVLDQLEVLERENRTLSVRVLMSNQLVEHWETVKRRFGAQTIIHQYGLTEAYGRNSSTAPTDSADQQRFTCGRPLDGVEFKVVDPSTGEEVAVGETGEPCLRGLVMRGYYHLPEGGEPAIDEDGWLHTQDLARVDKDGYVTYVGRLKAMLKVGGENVAAEEVEQCIREMPGVLNCCVVPLPDERRDQVPLAFVSLSPGASLSADEVIAWCSTQLSRFKVPQRVEFLESLPRLSNDKIDRPALMRQAEELAAVR